MPRPSSRAAVRVLACVVVMAITSLIAPGFANALAPAIRGGTTFDDARTLIVTTPGVGTYPVVSYDRGQTYTRLAIGSNPARCGVYTLVDWGTEPGYAFDFDAAPLNHTFPCAPNPPTCAKVLFLGAAGSGQSTASGAANHGMGAQVDSVYGQVRGTLPSGAVEGKALGYTAASVWTLAGAMDVYFGSVRTGTDLATSMLRLRATECPTQRIILAGYSQGAMVMHRVVNDLSRTGQTQILNRIDGVVLIADGDRLAGDNVTAWGSASRHSQGVGQFFQAISGSSSQKMPTSMQSRVHSICNTLDPVCAVLNPVSFGVALPALAPRVLVHSGYTGSSDVMMAAKFAAQRAATAP